MLAELKAIEIRDTIVSEIDTWWAKGANDAVSSMWNVDQAIQDGDEDPAILGRRVWVGIEPDGLNRFPVDRGHDEIDVPIRVVVFERYNTATVAGSPTVAWGDDLFKFTAALKDWLSDAKRTDWPDELTDFPPESSEYAFLFDPDRYASLNTWVSAFVVSYRGEVSEP